MSHIERLIAELCPDGVEFSNLGQEVRIRNGKSYKNLEPGDIPVYGSGGVMLYVNSAAHPGPSVLIPRKGSLSNIYYVDQPFWTVDTIFFTEIGKRLEPKFLYYYLIRERLGELNQAGGVPSLTQTMLNKVRIPVPPIEVQREIVRILDNFSQLEAELEAELEARRKQYEFYRDQLLSLDNAPRKPLGTIAIIGTGSKNTNEAVELGIYPFFVRSQEPRRINEFEFDEEAVITAGDGVGVGRVFHYVNGKYGLHQRAYRISPKTAEVSTKFLFYLLRSDFARYLTQISVHASVTSLRKPMFEKYPIPLPPLEEQERIVEILDKFDALVNDLSIGLPAELQARRKQYEYYRDQLLTFDELSA